MASIRNWQEFPVPGSPGLGPEKARALLILHALTGCDTVSSFAGHGKKTAWANWTVLPELTNALLKLSTAPSDILLPALELPPPTSWGKNEDGLYEPHWTRLPKAALRACARACV